MADFLKGNYKVNNGPSDKSPGKEPEKNLTERFEEEALAKLGGSLCFVTKGKTFVWTGKKTDKTDS